MGDASGMLGVWPTGHGRIMTILIFTVALLVSACDLAPSEVGSADSCRRVTVVDAADPMAKPLRGIEDMSVGASGIFLSAYDRLADREIAPRGGIYWLPLDRLTAAAETGHVAVSEITGQLPSLATILPHGIAYRPELDERLFVIDRRPADGGPAPAIWALEFSDSPGVPQAINAALVGRGSALCHANDLLPVGAGRLLVTRDRQSCGGFALFWELVTGRDAGTVIALSRRDDTSGTIVEVAGDLAFPNGIARFSHGQKGLDVDADTASLETVAVATTRDDRLWIMHAGTGEFTQLERLPGDGISLQGLDNLTPMDDGGLLAASHPNLFALFLHLQDMPGFRTAPSRVVRIHPDRPVELLYASEGGRPAGESFSGATVAVVASNRLVLGAAVDEGLLVCHLPGEPASDAAGIGEAQS